MLNYRNIIYTTLLLLFIPSWLFPQEEVLIRPQYQPRSDKHRNKIDELGRKQGLWKYYTNDGTLFMEITFQNDVKHGPSTRHATATGVIIEESNYFNGKRDGEYRRYNLKNIIISEGQYDNNRKSGKWVTYYPVNGEKKSEGEYVSGKREGLWVYYSSKGKLSAQGQYKYGLREGEWTYYTPDGSVAETKKFIKGSVPEEIKPVKTSEKVVKGFVMTPKKKNEKPKPGSPPGKNTNDNPNP